MPNKKIVFQGAGAGLSGLKAPGERIFLLSPANAGGERAQRLLSADCRTELALRLRAEGIRLGELFSFMSALYFRGKLAYAERFAAPAQNCAGVLVITPSRGLRLPSEIITVRDLEEMAAGRVDVEDERYLGPLKRDAERIRASLGKETQVVLLGSIATPKYVEPLAEVFGERLVFPAEFVGRGDMSRGGLLLKCTREAVELEYVRIAAAQSGAKKSAGGGKDAKSRRVDGEARNNRKER